LIVAIVVSYRPDWTRLGRVLRAIEPQVDSVVLVDDGTPFCDAALSGAAVPSGIRRLFLRSNQGIACAQNVGIEWARRKGASHVVLLDQDSEPYPDMIRHMVAAETGLGVRGQRLGALACTYVDERQRLTESFFRMRGMRMARFGCAEGDVVVETDAAIASGSMILMDALERVGGMREEMFIDLVDIEWYFRVRSFGYRCFGVCNAILMHQLGKTPRRFLGRPITHHSPLRSYYFFRNAIWLVKRNYSPWAWKLAVLRQLLQRFGFYVLAVPPRSQYLRLMTLGLYHGLRSRMGKLNGEHDGSSA
jgi:rhamnosyltransferase